MLSKDLEFRKNYENLKNNFPSLSNNILIVITGETPDLSEDVAKQLSTFLKKEKEDCFRNQNEANMRSD